MQTLIAALQSRLGGARERFPSGRYGIRTWERRRLLAWADVAVLHQIKLSALEARLFASLSRHRVFDLDDAIYVRKPRRLGEIADDSIWRRRKFQATCRFADVWWREMTSWPGRRAPAPRPRRSCRPRSTRRATAKHGNSGRPATIAWIAARRILCTWK